MKLTFPATLLFGAGLSLALGSPLLYGAPGDALNFAGTLFETDTDSPSRFLNDLDVTLAAPLPVDPGDLIGDSITVDDTHTGAIFRLNYFGSLDIPGGYGDPGDLTVLGTQSFQVTVTPKPGPGGLALAGLIGLVRWRRRSKVC